MIYIDPEIAPKLNENNVALHQISFEEWAGAPSTCSCRSTRFTPICAAAWCVTSSAGASFPSSRLPAGPSMKVGSEGMNVAALRERLGLPPGDKFDAALANVVKEYQQAHGLKADGIAGGGTIASLNLGANHYERLIIVNLERARRLPLANEAHRYILVDVGSARLYMYENGRPVDSMKVIVGKEETATPMMAAQLRYASVNPYWNVPPELVVKLIAPNVLKQGVTYLKDRRYEVLNDWSDEATALDPSTVDWQAAADGRKTIRVRQLPGPGQFDGQGQIYDAQRLRHLPPRHAPQGAVRRRQPVDQQRLHPAGRCAAAGRMADGRIAPAHAIPIARACRPARPGAGLCDLFDGGREPAGSVVPARSLPARPGGHRPLLRRARPGGGSGKLNRAKRQAASPALPFLA